MANGTIAFDTLSTSGQISGTAKSLDTDYVVSGSAKAFHGYGDQAAGTLNASSETLNISSYEDTGTGRSRLNISNAMSVSSTYAVIGSTNGYDYSHYGVTSTQYESGVVNSGGSYADGVTNTVIHGDLA